LAAVRVAALLACAILIGALLEWSSPLARAQTVDEQATVVSTVDTYLAVIDHTLAIASDPRSALVLAQNNLKQIYAGKGDRSGAIRELRGIIDGTGDLGVRTATRFTVYDIHREAGDLDLALEELRSIIKENLAALGGKSAARGVGD
jgi:hypothetical protein